MRFAGIGPIAENDAPSRGIRSSHSLPSRFTGKMTIQKTLEFPVPGDGFEPPTNGLQNRCSTTELTRQEIKITNEFGLPI